MRRVLMAVVGLLAGIATAVADERPNVFLELFTSQGCAACPPADALVAALDERDGVVAVTMPVKLWDFLGWADTLATDSLTKRQIAYSVARADRDVFTPQLVVNGARSVVGSDRSAVDGAIAQATEAGGLPLPITLAVASGILSVNVGEADIGADEATLWLMVIDRSVEVAIGEGENRGRRLQYHNVVRYLRPIGMWKGKAFAFDLPLTDVERGVDTSSVVIAQIETFKGPGRVVGASTLATLFPARDVARP